MIYGNNKQNQKSKNKGSGEQSSSIPAELTQILQERASLLDTSMDIHSVEKLEKDLLQGMNELNRNKRLHNNNISEMKQDVDKEI